MNPRTQSGRPHAKESASSRRSLELPSRTNGDDSTSAAILSALGELNTTINKLTKRLEKQKSHLESTEEKIGSATTSSSASESIG